MSFPRLQKVCGVEIDLVKAEVSSTWGPRFGGHAAITKRGCLVPYVVDGAIQHLCSGGPGDSTLLWFGPKRVSWRSIVVVPAASRVGRDR